MHRVSVLAGNRDCRHFLSRRDSHSLPGSRSAPSEFHDRKSIHGRGVQEEQQLGSSEKIFFSTARCENQFRTAYRVQEESSICDRTYKDSRYNAVWKYYNWIRLGVIQGWMDCWMAGLEIKLGGQRPRLSSLRSPNAINKFAFALGDRKLLATLKFLYVKLGGWRPQL